MPTIRKKTSTGSLQSSVVKSINSPHRGTPRVRIPDVAHPSHVGTPTCSPPMAPMRVLASQGCFTGPVSEGQKPHSKLAHSAFWRFAICLTPLDLDGRIPCINSQYIFLQTLPSIYWCESVNRTGLHDAHCPAGRLSCFPTCHTRFYGSSHTPWKAAKSRCRWRGTVTRLVPCG